MKIKDLAKMMLVFNFLYQTEKPTKAVRVAIAKMKKSFKMILKTRKSFYDEAEALQKELYAKAWNNTHSDKADGQYMSLGTLIMLIFESVKSQTIVGTKVMEKTIDSYCFANANYDDEYQLEVQSKILADEFIRLIDGEVKEKRFNYAR